VEIDWGKNPELILLVMDAGECEATCICVMNDRLLHVGLREDWCFGKGRFEVCFSGSVPRVHSNFREPCVLSKFHLGAITIAYF
jgi:hypothetical protein